MPSRPCDLDVDEIEQPLRHRETVGARVELRGEVPEREVELGREHEHGQAGLEADAALDEAHADGDGHERDPERCRELEHRAREERDAQRRHRRAAVLLAHRTDLLRLRLAAVEGAKRRQAAHDVEEVRREQRERLPALAGTLLACSGRPAT